MQYIQQTTQKFFSHSQKVVASNTMVNQILNEEQPIQCGNPNNKCFLSLNSIVEQGKYVENKLTEKLGA